MIGRILDYTALILTIIGAINWGLIGFFEFLRLIEQDKIYANEYVNGNQCVLFLCTDVNSFFNDKFYHINLRGLDGNSNYKISYMLLFLFNIGGFIFVKKNS